MAAFSDDIGPVYVHQCPCDTCQNDPHSDTAKLHRQMNLFM